MDPTVACDTHTAIKCHCDGSPGAAKHRAGGGGEGSGSAEGEDAAASAGDITAWAHLRSPSDSPDAMFGHMSSWIRERCAARGCRLRRLPAAGGRRPTGAAHAARLTCTPRRPGMRLPPLPLAPYHPPSYITFLFSDHTVNGAKEAPKAEPEGEEGEEGEEEGDEEGKEEGAEQGGGGGGEEEGWPRRSCCGEDEEMEEVHEEPGMEGFE
jgi:hypothetical protein